MAFRTCSSGFFSQHACSSVNGSAQSVVTACRCCLVLHVYVRVWRLSLHTWPRSVAWCCPCTCLVLPLHMLLAWQIRRHHESTITLCRYTSSRFLKMCLSNKLHLHRCLSAAVGVRRSGHPGPQEVRSSNQADEDRRVALAASRVQQGCALLGSLRGCSWGTWHGGLECWSSGVVSAVSQDSWCMCAIQCVCLCTYWQLHLDTAQATWVQLRNGPCVRVLHHAMKSLCPTRSICKDITLLLLLNTELCLSHWSASNAWCVVEGYPTTLCIGALQPWLMCSGEMLWENGDRLPCAFKKVPYERHAERCRADAELAALRDAAGCPHIVQCYGAFDHREPADGKHYLWIAMQ